MKTPRFILAAILAALPGGPSAAAQTTAPTRYVVGLPSELATQEDAKVVLGATLRLIVGAQPGDVVEVFDAKALQRLASVQIPVISGAQANSTKARLVRLQADIAPVQRHIVQSAEHRTGHAGELLVPEFLDLIGRHRGQTGAATRVILLGGPYYRAQLLSFGPGEYPGDGTLLVPSTASPFGTADRSTLLRDARATVYWSYLTEAQFASASSDGALESMARRSVTRFWSCFVSRLGGSLSAFCASPDVAIDAALSGGSTPVVQDQLTAGPAGADIVLEIVRVTVVETPTASPTPTPPQSPPVAPPAVPPAAPRAEPAAPKRPSTSPVAESGPASAPRAESPDPNSVVDATLGAMAPLPTTRGKVVPGRVRIVLAWYSTEAATDLDLRVRPVSSAQEINYRTPTQTEGRLLRDIQSVVESKPSDWLADWEVIELKRTTLEELARDGRIYVNLFRASGHTATQATLRLEDEFGRKLDLPVRFPAGVTGDCAKGALALSSDRDLNPCWCRVNLQQALASLQASSAPRSR